MRALAVFAALAHVAAGGYVCPSYDEIRQPSVDASVFSMNDIQGVWYLQATTEPTTKACLCNVMNYTVGSEVYRYTDTCYEDMFKNNTWQNFTVTLGGHLSTNVSTPGVLHEGFVVYNHSIAEKPNMLFNVTRNAVTGELTEMHFYACLGELIPFTKPVFSYLYYTRHAAVPLDSVKEAVARDKALYDFDMEGLVFTNRSTWGVCSVL
eukprot:Hpha_TRINITY_DN15884_c3_g1::TRINITY_DN15884_c3_g1_i2::g.188468::m.188468